MFLYIFDADGTLCERPVGDLLPGVEDKIRALRFGGCKIAIATNQGGPACRDAGWPWSYQYPTVAEVEAHYGRLAERLGARLYMSLLYQVKSSGALIAPAGMDTNDPRLDPEWRKPRPGMLWQAMADAGVPASQTVFVGDSTEDEAAARAAGVLLYYHAREFFSFLLTTTHIVV